ncbi:phosphoenolpyruvate carboxykinase (ATP) [Arenibacterium sp. LLYu02]|uniref:phosphoenolpyruvate carboxykinase (ATP) n=1 Tax=Arenibacterium sp. LLYu02 TaxID=3404132 RepID=UPI003B21B2B5
MADAAMTVPTQSTSAAHPLSDIGLYPKAVRYNASVAALLQTALAAGEGQLSAEGGLVVRTGAFTGRSPKDKHVVDHPSYSAEIWWQGNNAMTPNAFRQLKEDLFAYLEDRTVEVQDLVCGAEEDQAVNIRLVAEYHWHALFLRHLLTAPDEGGLTQYRPEFTIVNAPGFLADPTRHGCRSKTVIAVDFEEKLVLIAGTEYAGENKKSAFTILNHLYPKRGILPMHCSANHAKGNPEDSAIFFGLSGTGKTTLSSDSERILIGDDEHGWSDDGIFNFEGGCYAKTIHLSASAEPEIWQATHQFSTVLENVSMDPDSRRLDLDDGALTENTRAAYPLSFIPNASLTRRGGTPRHVMLLTCDAFGVTPPIARVTPKQARALFLLGFTSKVAGTERGVNTVVPTFSTCFGAPFLTRDPKIYADLFEARLQESGAQCWLVNTGWTGGDFETGHRMPIAATRELLVAALSDGLEGVSDRPDPLWGLAVPAFTGGEAAQFLDPQATWSDPTAFEVSAERLCALVLDEAERLGLMDEMGGLFYLGGAE